MVSLADVKNWKPEVLNEIATTVRQRQQTLVHSGDDFGRLMPMASWTGPAAEAAQGTHQQLMTRLMALTAVSSAVSKGLMQAADAIPPVKSAITNAEELARKYGFTVDANGQVTDNFAGKQPPPEMHPEDRAHAHEQVVADLTQALRTAEDIDNDLDSLFFRAAFGEYADFHQGTVAAAADAGLKEIGLTLPEPPPGATPAQNAAWWATLSKAGKSFYEQGNPGVVGKLDGLPIEVRDRANRFAFERKLGDLRNQRDAIQHKLDGMKESDPAQENEYHELEDRLKSLDGKIDGMNKLHERLDQPPDTPEHNKYYLIDIDTQDDGKAILAKGNPDTAAHVSTYVPGTTADLASFNDEVDRADLMNRAAIQAGGGSTSTITWLGYDAPDAIQNAASESYADGGKQSFDNFQQGLRESHQGQPSHNVAIGHSYGTTLIGHAARDGHLPVDDMVLIASPGVGVDRASQLHMPPEHVFSTTADKDVIQVTNFPRSPSGEGLPIDPLGPSPTDPEFGGKVFTSARGTSALGQLELPSIDAHGEYWTRDNPALASVGKIMAGRQP